MKVWIVVEEFEEQYDPQPTGVVFQDEDKAKAYIEKYMEHNKLVTLGLMEGEML